MTHDLEQRSLAGLTLNKFSDSVAMQRDSVLFVFLSLLLYTYSHFYINYCDTYISTRLFTIVVFLALFVGRSGCRDGDQASALYQGTDENDIVPVAENVDIRAILKRIRELEENYWAMRRRVKNFR